LWVSESTKIERGCLKISGVNLGERDFDYWYNFDVKNTKRLIAILSGQSQECDVQKLLIDNFGGLFGLSKLRELCKLFEIQCDYVSL